MEDQALAIQLDDGRTIVARPRPEDQDILAQLPGETRARLRVADYDIEGHGWRLPAEELIVDVEGHAMTLRLPTAADAQAVRKALMVGALTATVVAAGAIASMQPAPTATAPGAAVPAPAPAPAAEFQVRQQQATDQMLSAPAAAPSMTGIDDASASDLREFPARAHASGAGAASSGTGSAGASSQATPADPDSDIGLADQAAQKGAEQWAAGSAAASGQAGAPSQANPVDPDYDLGFADQAAQQGAEQFAEERGGQ